MIRVSSKDEICTCEYCGAEGTWEGGTDGKGNFFYCENCDKLFCTNCWEEQRNIPLTDDVEKILCKECDGYED